MVPAALEISRTGEGAHVWVFFEEVVQARGARYVLGLSATLVRRDGLQPILFMQFRPISHTAERPAGAPQTLELVSRTHELSGLPTDLPIQALMRRLTEEQQRRTTTSQRSLPLWLGGWAGTEPVPAAWPPERTAAPPTLTALEGLLPESARIVLATGRLVGEGIDHPPLDTLLLAMPVSRKGTVQQYASRLHRQQNGLVS